MSKFSVLVANYNNGRFFKDCFQSLIKQSYQDFEVIIVDDCSTDNSLEIIKELIEGDSRFKLFINSENRGCGYTKKRGIELASGAICGFLDPDDVLAPEAIRLMTKYHEEQSDMVGIYSKFMVCDEALSPKYVFTKSRKMPKYNLSFLNLDLRVGHFFTFKKKFYDKTDGLDPQMQSAVDQDLYLKLYEQGNFKFLPEVLYHYRVHKKGISQNNSKEKAKLNWYQLILETVQRRGLNKVYAQEAPNSIQEVVKLYQPNLYQKVAKKIKEKIG